MIRGLLACLFFVFSCKPYVTKSNTKADETDEDLVGLDLEMTDVDLPGPLENLYSLLFDTPVFGDRGSKRTELTYAPKEGRDPVASAIEGLRARPDLTGLTAIEDAKHTDITVVPTPSGYTLRRFHGVCIDGKVFAMGAYKSNGADVIRNDEESYLLRKVAVMPASYRPDLKGCRERFLELVNIKFREQAQAANSLQDVETLNFAFMFMPGYAGAENISNGNVVVGVAEIVGDIATLGVATKFKAGWNTLNMSRRMFQSVQKGSQLTTIGANTVRLGYLIKDVRARGASVSDIPTAVLLVTETGFVAMKIKVKATKLSALKKAAANIANASDAIALREVLGKLGKKINQLEPDALAKMFKSKYVGQVNPGELARIRQAAANGESLAYDDIHKLMSYTSLRVPDTMINVTSNNTFLQVADNSGTYYGYVGFPGLPKGLFATAKPISWNSLDLLTTQGSAVSRDVMMVFVGDAAREFKKVKIESGFFGQSTVIGKTTLKPKNPEFVTKTGDVRFTDFDIHNDGTRTLVVVKKIETLDELKGVKMDSPEYKKITRIRTDLYCTVVLGDLLVGADVLGTGAVASGSALLLSDAVSKPFFEWLYFGGGGEK